MRVEWWAVALVLAAAVAACPTTAAGSTWRGAVLDHTPSPWTPGANASQVASANIAAYAAAATAAAGAGVDLLVFPEFGITSGGVFSVPKSEQRAAVASFAQALPSEAAVAAAAADGAPLTPCENAAFDGSPQLQALSCAARDAAVWLAANMVESADAGAHIYNTEVVFDASGGLAAVYRKSHVWFHSAFDEPATPDVVSFDASFASGNITMGLMVCFDIAFHDPGVVLVDDGVSVFPYSVSQGIVGPEIARSWSALHRTTILAANDGGHVSIYVHGASVSTTSVPVPAAPGNTVIYADLAAH